ncbi:hypothetical protein HDU85_001976, partial [Gaertneriomyces sp. JEL0708]
QSSPIILTNITQPAFTNSDDGINTEQIFLPFPIQVYGVDWDRIWFNTNGALFFGSIGSTSGSVTLPIAAGDVESLPVIAAAWSDLYLEIQDPDPAVHSAIVHSTQGTVGQRQFIVSYRKLRFYVLRADPNVLASFDIVFYENPARQGDVDIRYYRWNLGSQPDYAFTNALTVGMQSFDDASSYFQWREGQTPNHTLFAQQFVGKQLSFRYIGEDIVNVSCGSFGYDFAPLRGMDLNYTDPASGDQYFLNICGEINHPVCANNVTTEKSMICKVPANGAYPIDLGVFGPGSIRYQLPAGTSPGLHMTMQNGQYCRNISSQSYTQIQMQCGPTAGQIVVAFPAPQSPNPCVYIVIVLTNLACQGAVRDNSTAAIYRASTLPGCVSTNAASTAGYTGTLCPRPGHGLEPPTLTDPITAFIAVESGLAQVVLPFSFPFYGQSYTHLNISVKGALLFGAVPYDLQFASGFPDLGMNSAANEHAAWPMIVGFGGDLKASSGYGIVPTPQISYSTERDSLGRAQWVARFWDMRFENTKGLVDSSISFDIVLTEGGGIDIKYYVVAPSNNRYSIGLRGPHGDNNYTAHTSYQQLTTASAFTLRGTTLSFTTESPSQCTPLPDIDHYHQYD